MFGENVGEHTPLQNSTNDESGSSAVNIGQRGHLGSKAVIEIVSPIFNFYILVQEKKNLTEHISLRKRKPIQKIDKFYSYGGLKDDESDGSEEYNCASTRRKKRGKRSKKQHQKKRTTSSGKSSAPKDEADNRRYVPDGVSIFDLIMPWKQEVKPQAGQVPKDLHKVVTISGKNKVQNEQFEKYSHDVQAILVNPPWDCTNPLSNAQSDAKKGKNGRITIEDFVANFKIPTSVMKDGLVFIWVEKEIISDLMKCFEA